MFKLDDDGSLIGSAFDDDGFSLNFRRPPASSATMMVALIKIRAITDSVIINSIILFTSSTTIRAQPASSFS
jgi:hypothetical protein